MNNEDIVKQSEAAVRQWGEQWERHALAHKDHSAMKNDFAEYENSGVGRAILCVGNGYSLEENIDTIRENQHTVDILCCDKTLGALLDHGITPDFVMVCDANVNYEKYMEPWKERLANTTLLMNVCANPLWTQNGNWQKIVFFVNKDVLGTEAKFMQLSGCRNVILAATNVSNAMLVLLTQATQDCPRNFFGYDKILLIGFDYSWKYGGKYYAFNEDGDGKAFYMKHMYLYTSLGNAAYTSGNLWFSLQWIANYINVFKLPVIQCAGDSILQFGPSRDLESQMQYEFKPEHSKKVRNAVKELRAIMQRKKEIESVLKTIGKQHQESFLGSI